MERLTFKMGEAFPADDPIAVWVLNLSIALGDLRIAATYAVRAEQPAYERLYFVRVFASHLREILKLLDLDYRERLDVRNFVAELPQEAQEEREEAVQLLNATFPSRREVEVWKDLRRLRNDTFHYARDDGSRARLRASLHAVSKLEGAYMIGDEGWLRADYADLVVANRMHPFEEDLPLPVTSELHETILKLNGHVAKFIAAAEAHQSFSE